MTVSLLNVIKNKEIIQNIIVSKSLIFQNILEIKIILFFLKICQVFKMFINTLKKYF